MNEKLDKLTVQIFDTTLRDGSQTAGISFSAEDKKRIANHLAEFGIQWIEGGWPGASPKDDLFFELMRDRKWSNSKLVAFGSTARPGNNAKSDPGLKNLIQSGADAVCIFGKAWQVHVSKALGISKEDNLKLVADSISYLKEHFETVFFDAEHFFDATTPMKVTQSKCLMLHPKQEPTRWFSVIPMEAISPTVSQRWSPPC